MFRQTGQLSSSELDTPCSGLPGSRRLGGEDPHTSPGTSGLPSFLSSAPPRSEGEALLRRIFSRREVV